MNKSNVSNSYRDDLRKNILDCAMNNFMKKGIKSVIMDDIANELSISKRTLYELFHNKEDLVTECIKDFNANMEEKLSKQLSPNSDVIEILIKFMKMNLEESSGINPLFYEDLHKYPNVLKYLTKKQDIRRTHAMSFMIRGVDEGYFRSDVNYEIVNSILEVFMKHVMDTQLYNQYPLAQIINNVIVIILRGICTDKGLEEFQKINSPKTEE